MMRTLVLLVHSLLLPLGTAFSPILPRHAPLGSSSALQVVKVESLTAEQEHAREVFNSYDTDDSGAICEAELGEMLHSLDIDATDEESAALFKYLADGTGNVSFDNFIPWYSEAVDAARSSAQVFQQIIRTRRTVDSFDKTPVDKAVLERAIECAIAAPNRRMTEPWRFIHLGPKTIDKVRGLKKKTLGEELCSNVPGWVVVTYKLTPNDQQAQREDFKSVCCSMENFMLSMWSEGIGSKWTDGPLQRTQEFADLCKIDLEKERVAGVIWYGFASGGLGVAEPKQRQKGVDDVLTSMP